MSAADQQTSTLAPVTMPAQDAGELTACGEVVVLRAPGRPAATFANVTVTDSELEVDAPLCVDAAQARMLAAYFLNLADTLDAAVTA